MPSSEPRVAAASLPSALADLPVVAALSPEHRALVLAAFVRVELEFGEVVVREGDPSDAFFVVLAGSARIVTTAASGDEVALGVLRPGDQFGEDGILDGVPRNATVRASDALEVARLDAAVLQALIALHPELADLLERQRHARRVQRLLTGHRAFAELPGSATSELLGLFERLVVADGDAVVRAGEPSDALFLVEDGLLRVVRETAGGEVTLRRLHSGELLGERGVLLSQPRSATVIAEGAVSVLRLDAAAVGRLRDEHPGFDRALAEKLAAYERRDREAARGDTAPVPAPVPRREDPTGGLEVGDEPGVTEGDRSAAGPTRRFPIVRQLDAMDCGAACVAMVCRRYGRPVSLSYIRNAVGTGHDGTSLRGIQRGGTLVGLDVPMVKSSPDRLDELALPAIVHVRGNHWVVLHEVGADHVRLADPGRGRKRQARAEFLGEWSGYAALPTPTPALDLAPAASTSVRWLWPHLRPFRRVFALALMLALVVSGLDMLLPVLSQKIVDNVLSQHDYRLLDLLAGGMVVAIFASLALDGLQQRLLARAAVHIDASALDFLLTRMLELPLSYFETRRSSDVEQRLDGMRDVRQLLVQRGIVALSDLTLVVAAIVVMGFYSMLLALCFMATIPLYGGLMVVSSTRLRPTFESAEEGRARLRTHHVDVLKGIETVKVMGAEEESRRHMVVELRKLSSRLLRADLTVMGYGALVQATSYLVSLGFLWGGALLVLSGGLTVGGLLLVNSLVLLGTAPVIRLLDLWDEFQFSSVLLGRLQDVFEQEPEQSGGAGTGVVLDRLEGRVTFRGVDFHYPGTPDRPVLQGIDLDVPAGTTVAFVGRSGCGKSTLLKCLASLNAITGGSIAFDGQDLATCDRVALRRRIGFVLQQPYLFDQTIAENIAFGDPEPDLAAVRRAAEIADAHGFVERLALGYDTMIGESGLSLSGGQAQRIAIARAVYHDPAVLLLDEATSALDAETERNVKENLDRVLQGRTAFVVAHRLSTIRDADLIVVLDEGRIVESGTHEALLRRDGLYAHLHAQQLAD